MSAKLLLFKQNESSVKVAGLYIHVFLNYKSLIIAYWAPNVHPVELQALQEAHLHFLILS